MKKKDSYIIILVYIVLFFLVWDSLSKMGYSLPTDNPPLELIEFRNRLTIFLTIWIIVVVVLYFIPVIFIFKRLIKWAIITGTIIIILYLTPFILMIYVHNNITQYRSFIYYLPYSIVVLCLLIGFQFTLISFKVREKVEVVTKRAQRERLEEIISSSDRVNISDLMVLLKVKQKSFERKLLDWATEFSLLIDGDEIIINEETISDFIDALDAQYIKWEKTAEAKIDKI